ncbi:hypothetical protein TrLO_g436 [Triparma laevis f. longispina]|uniref:Glucose-methanol-choline oxidoreductase C-terminal domain-containing protein n=1 Tax=Triparma laevis f. longispina TaxID=1714387 RepID=A0A9W7E983_9STRA|nr:hypothetical protein TrLO_g436 [Triparma laevis f. longispina]
MRIGLSTVSSPIQTVMIIGTGPAACSAARTLLDGNPHIKVVMLSESPSSYISPASSTTKGWTRGKSSSYESHLPSIIQTSGPCKSRKLTLPIGRGLGGSTRINAMLHFNLFTSFGSSNSSILSASKQIDSELKSNKKVEPNIIDPTYIKTLGLKLQTSSGYKSSQFYTSTFENKRVNSFQALYLDTLNPHFTVLYNSRVDKLNFNMERTHVTSLTLSTGKSVHLTSTTTLILSCGSICSPLLLDRSGYDCLENNKVYDHPVLPILYFSPTSLSKVKKSNTGVQGWWSGDEDRVQFMIFDGDVVVELLEHVTEVFRRSYENIFKDIFFKLLFLWAFYNVYIVRLFLPKFIKNWLGNHLVCINIQPVKVKSNGKINKDGSFSTNFFENEEDKITLNKAWKVFQKDFDKPLKEKGCINILPGPLSSNILTYAGHFTTSYFHPHSSLSHVVNEDFGLKGVENLKVADASVVKEGFGGPTALGCMGVGRKVGEIILEENK